jgi:hypothetical protein
VQLVECVCGDTDGGEEGEERPNQALPVEM